MCGIYGYIGKNSIVEVLGGIKRLDYRGYDSAGVAFLKGGEIVAIKQKGYISNLESLLVGQTSSVTIGHTRWATHGEPSRENSHPHLSEDGNWAIVHNGIIENYLDLKEIVKDEVFSSQTDSEVAAHLLQKYYNGNILETIKKVCDMIVGSFAFAIITTYAPQSIFVAKRNSPVIVGSGKNYGVICSDINSLGDFEDAYLLENDNFGVVSQGKLKIFDKNLAEIMPQNLAGLKKEKREGLGGYAHYMLKEIDQIPKAVSATIKNNQKKETFEKAIPADLVKNIENVLIIGCGTAYHAGLIGARLFKEAGFFSEALLASEFRYDTFLKRDNTLAIFVSQSGETADTIKALKMCKERGIPTLAMTNVKNSSITFESDYVVFTSAGVEISVASTKAYNAQVTLFYLLAAYFEEIKENKAKNLEKMAKKLKKVANLIKNNEIKPLCQEIARKIYKSKNIFMLGRGVDYNIAQEFALKLKEISYIHCEAIPAGELKHGSISLIDKSKFVFAFATQKNVAQKTISNISEVLSRQGRVIIFSQFDFDIDGVYKYIKIPPIDEKFMPLFIINYLQLISYYTSLLLGHNPDKPRSLAKSVTVE